MQASKEKAYPVREIKEVQGDEMKSVLTQHSEPKPEALKLKRQCECETPLNEIVSVPSPNATKVKAIDTRPSMLTESSEQAFTEAQFQHILSNTDLL